MSESTEVVFRPAVIYEAVSKIGKRSLSESSNGRLPIGGRSAYCSLTVKKPTKLPWRWMVLSKMSARALLVVMCFLTFSAAPVTALAGLLAYEGFDYPTGTLHNAGGVWTADAGQNVASDSLSYTGLPTTGNHVDSGAGLFAARNFNFDPVFSTAGTYYLTMLGRVDEIASGLDGVGVPSFQAFGGTFNSFLRPIVLGNGTATIPIGFDVLHRTGEFNSGGLATLNLNETFFLAIRVINDGGTGGDQIDFVLNPTLASGEPDWTTDALFSSAAFDITTVGSTSTDFRIDRNYDWDEFRIATTWDEAVAVPEPSTFALLGIGAIGLIGYRRRKRQQAA